MNEWVRVAKVSDVPQGKAVTLTIENRSIALFLSGKDFRAVDNFCPHKGASLAEGSLENGEVTCAWHAWTFSLATGECSTVPGAKIHCYSVKVEKGDVFVKL